MNGMPSNQLAATACACLCLVLSAGLFAQDDRQDDRQDDQQAYQSGGSDPSAAPGRPQGAEGPPTGRPSEPLGFTWTVSGGDLYQFNGSIDGGGSVSVNRAFLETGLEYRFSPSLAIGFKIGTEIDSYDFKDGGEFAAAAGGTPWTTINEFSLGTSLRWKIDEEWSPVLCRKSWAETPSTPRP